MATPRFFVKRYFLTDTAAETGEVEVALHEHAVVKSCELTKDGIAIDCAFASSNVGALAPRKFRLLNVGGATFEPTGTANYVGTLVDLDDVFLLFEIVGSTATDEITVQALDVDLSYHSGYSNENVPGNAVLRKVVGDGDNFYIYATIVGTPTGDTVRRIQVVGANDSQGTNFDPYYIDFIRHENQRVAMVFEMVPSANAWHISPRYYALKRQFLFSNEVAISAEADLQIVGGGLWQPDWGRNVRLFGFFYGDGGNVVTRTFRALELEQQFVRKSGSSTVQPTSSPPPNWLGAFETGYGSASLWETT